MLLLAHRMPCDLLIRSILLNVSENLPACVVKKLYILGREFMVKIEDLLLGKENRFMQKLLLISGSILIFSCAHHRDVRPGADGIHRVVIQTSDKSEGARQAIAQANNYCEEYKKHPAFIDEKQAYTGDMDEQKYNTGKKLSKAAKVVGGAAWVFGGRNESNAGGVVGLGGAAADAALGDGYTVTMSFKCM